MSETDGLLEILPVPLANRVHIAQVLRHDFVGGPPAGLYVPFGCVEEFVGFEGHYLVFVL